MQQGGPFLNTDVDYLGLVCIYYKTLVQYKGSTSEDIIRLTSDAVLGSLKKFIGRKEYPSRSFSHTATNFMGARNGLQNLLPNEEMGKNEQTTLWDGFQCVLRRPEQLSRQW